MSYIDSKNCFEHLMTNEMGLDRAPLNFKKLCFLVPPTSAYFQLLMSRRYIIYKNTAGVPPSDCSLIDIHSWMCDTLLDPCAIFPLHGFFLLFFLYISGRCIRAAQ